MSQVDAGQALLPRCVVSLRPLRAELPSCLNAALSYQNCPDIKTSDLVSSILRG